MRLNYRSRVRLEQLKLWWKCTRLYAVWQVAISRKRWVFVSDGDGALQLVSKGWKLSDAREIVREVHKRAFFDVQTTAAADEAQDIIDQK